MWVYALHCGMSQNWMTATFFLGMVPPTQLVSDEWKVKLSGGRYPPQVPFKLLIH